MKFNQAKLEMVARTSAPRKYIFKIYILFSL